jgi:hypothetical protein
LYCGAKSGTAVNPLVLTIHPSYVLRIEDEESKQTEYERDWSPTSNSAWLRSERIDVAPGDPIPVRKTPVSPRRSAGPGTLARERHRRAGIDEPADGKRLGP